MMITPQKHRFNISDWHQMGKQNLFLPDARMELIEGEIIDMVPIGTSHAGCVSWLNHFFVTQVAGSAIVKVQDPVQLGNFSEPQPDLMILRPEPHFYRKRHPTSVDVLLLIEVAESTLNYDRRTKMPLYARYGIVEAWIVNLEQNCIEVYLKPQAAGYQKQHIFQSGEVIIPSQLELIKVSVSAVLG